MNRSIQKTLLQVIKLDGGKVELNDLLKKANRRVWQDEEIMHTNDILTHQLDLMVEKDLVKKNVDQKPWIFYVLMPRGYESFDPFYKKVFRFVMYDKHNLYILISVFVSITALVISILALNK